MSFITAIFLGISRENYVIKFFRLLMPQDSLSKFYRDLASVTQKNSLETWLDNFRLFLYLSAQDHEWWFSLVGFFFPGQQSDEVLIHLLPSYKKRELTFWGKIRWSDKKEHITDHLNFHTGNLRGEPISNNFFISTATPCYTDSGLIRTPHYYRQDHSLGKPEKLTDLNGLQIHKWSQSLYALCRC